MLLEIIVVILFLLVAVIAFVLYRENAESEKCRPNYRTYYETLYLVDTENEDLFDKAYKDDYEENEEYYYSAKELREDYEDEKVYKYAPYRLPLKIENTTVYSSIEKDEWIRVGRIKKTDIDKIGYGEVVSLSIYPMIYKYVGSEITKEESDPYFALSVEKKVKN